MGVYFNQKLRKAPNKEDKDMKEILKYYGYETIEEFASSVGLHPVDAERLIKEMYEEDTAPLAQ